MVDDEAIRQLMDEGLTYREVAEKLGISLGTLGNHMKRLHRQGYPYRGSALDDGSLKCPECGKDYGKSRSAKGLLAWHRKKKHGIPSKADQRRARSKRRFE